jgi:hypothetical protein
MLNRVISGGQTGADQAGWRAARRFGIETGGWMPLDWMAEDGPHPEFMGEFGAEEWPELCLTLAEQYRERTIANIRLKKPDYLIWFGDPTTPGGRLTLRVWGNGTRGRPCTVVGSPDYHHGGLNSPLQRSDPTCLMIAGNRESKAPGIGAWVEEYLAAVFRALGFREG